MPLHIIADDNPRKPAWGELPLEVYFLSEWEKSHPDPSQSNESPTDRRKRLLRQFLTLGYERRLNGLLMGGVVLDDESIFGGLDLAAALEIFPERVTNEGVSLKVRDQALRDIVAAEQEGSDSGEDDYSDEVKEYLARQRAKLEENSLSRYSLYQADCVVTHIYVEDEVAINGGGLLHVFLDDCGNVVRQWRVHNDGSEDHFDGAWFERTWKGDFECDKGEIGPAYHEGGSRGPPYTI
ncbi:uncharacterized protein N7477_004615 [Penicillium maclennaniae]|uniref:uncharacterized protein n=1 Tax=Penicillium maclennaniae TaxID=1343394 RepID=UPI002540FAF2|nr:uncharacterized protein N7477_004615 [Penicillium maclennaniae]KAJ5674681.1 hypothetical protein N7477_004615 [Penicillium maclennaniae]